VGAISQRQLTGYRLPRMAWLFLPASNATTLAMGAATFAGEDDAKCPLRWRPPGTLWGRVPPPSTETVGQFRTSVNVYIGFRPVTSTRHPAQPFDARGQIRAPAFRTSPRARRHAFSPEARKLASPTRKPLQGSPADPPRPPRPTSPQHLAQLEPSRELPVAVVAPDAQFWPRSCKFHGNLTRPQSKT
jgi:hypothetical protein